MEKFNYPALLESNTQTLETVFGASETLYSCDTYQFTDYSRYDMNLFDEAAKRDHRDAQFPIDLAAARALGKRLVEKATRRSRSRRPKTPSWFGSVKVDPNLPHDMASIRESIARCHGD